MQDLENTIEECNCETTILNKEANKKYLVCTRCSRATTDTTQYTEKPGVIAEVYQRDGHYKRHKIYTRKQYGGKTR